MRLRRLVIDSLPGIEPRFVFEPLGDGVNIVTGPNAIGKSSLIRALTHLLAPTRQDPPALALEAEFASGDERWQVTRNGRDIVWRRNGEARDRPAFLAEDPIALHRLSIENLLQDDDSDQDLAARLRRELYGNYDLAAVRIPLRQRVGRSEANTLTQERRQREGIERNYAALQERETGLPALAQRIEEAHDAARECQLLERAVELVEAVDAREARQAVVDRYPPNMDRLLGDEGKQLEDSAKRRSELQQELRDKQRGRDAAADALASTGLAHSAPADEDVQAAADWLRQIYEIRTQRDAAVESADMAAEELRDAVAQLGGDSAPPRLDAEAVQQAHEVARPLIAAQARLVELREQLGLIGQMPEAGTVARHRQGVEALRIWLASDDAQPPAAPAVVRAAPWIALAAVAIAALIALMQGSGWIAVAAAIAAVGVALSLHAQRRFAAISHGSAATAEQRYRDTDLRQPASWSAQDVRTRLHEIEDRLNELLAQQKLAGKRESTDASVNATAAKVAALEAQCRSLAEQVGFDPELPIASFDRFVSLCANWDRARQRHDQLVAQMARLDQQRDDLAGRVRAFLNPWRTADASSLEQAPQEVLQRAFEGLQRRMQAAARERSEIAKHETATVSLRDRISDSESFDAGLFTRAGLAQDAAAALHARLDRLTAWREAADALRDAQADEARLRRLLEPRPDLIELVDDNRRAELQARLSDLKSKADEHEALIRNEAAIKSELDAAGGDRRLEQAIAGERRAEQSLSEKRDEALLAVATKTLLDDVERAFETEHEPTVLRRARAVFAEVTAHAFDLSLADDNTFRARDALQDVPLSLGELSAGTRMQLLLALRLAWIESQEPGMETMPLFLDEAMTTSDEGRFAEMARSLERLAAAEGRQRQIFYLCARRHEYALWQQATGTVPPVIDLAAVRFPARATPPEDFFVATPTPLPSPDDQDAESYASAIGVPQVEPLGPATGIHLFHVLRDDLPLLHRLVDQWRVASLGQLDGLLASDTGEAAIADTTLRERLATRSRCAKIWIDLWREGRGRPVDRGALEQSGAVSTVFIDRTATLAAALDGDGERLVAALREGALAHFHTSKIDDLEHWLTDVGRIDERPRLTAEERRRLTLRRVGSADVETVNRVVDWLEASAGES